MAIKTRINTSNFVNNNRVKRYDNDMGAFSDNNHFIN
jgi:hypothetical protein